MKVKKPKISMSPSQQRDHKEHSKRPDRGEDVAGDANLDRMIEIARESFPSESMWGLGISAQDLTRGEQQKVPLAQALKYMEAELAPRSHRELELVDWVLRCWVLSYEADGEYEDAVTNTNITPSQAREHMNAAHHRLLEAIHELATARRPVSPAPGDCGARQPPRGTRRGRDRAASPAGPATAPGPQPPGAADVRCSGATQGDLTCGQVAAGHGATTRYLTWWIEMVAWSEEGWISLIVRRDKTLSAALRLEVKALKAKLYGPAPGLLECMLVDRIVMDMLQAAYADRSYEEWKSSDLRISTPALHRMDFAHRWLVAAIKQLVILRQLQAPAAGSLEVRPSSAGPQQTADTGLSLPYAGIDFLEVSMRHAAQFLRFLSPAEDAGGKPRPCQGAPPRKRIIGFDLERYIVKTWLVRLPLREEEREQELASALQAELAGPAPSPVERLLVDRVVISYLQRVFADSVYRSTRNFHEDQAIHARRCMDAANCRQRSVTRELEAVRKLLSGTSNSVKAPGSPPDHWRQAAGPADSPVRFGDLPDAGCGSSETATGAANPAASKPARRQRRGRAPGAQS